MCKTLRAGDPFLLSEKGPPLSNPPPSEKNGKREFFAIRYQKTYKIFSMQIFCGVMPRCS